MASNPFKRRKLSPFVAVPVLEPQTPTRASYMSPTHASLSRFNPSLLPRPSIPRERSPAKAPPYASTLAAPNTIAKNDLLARGEAALNYIMGGLNTAMGVAPPVPTSAIVTGEETDEQMAAMRAENAARREKERLDGEKVRKEKRRFRSSEFGRGVEELPEPVVEDVFEEQVDRQEDELPETPEALRIQMQAEDTPPRGILFSSPYKRKKRRDRFREALENSGDVATADPADDPVQHSPGRKDAEPGVRVERPPAKDPETIAKEQERDQLQQELRLLREDIARHERLVAKLAAGSDELQVGDMTELITVVASEPVQSEPTPVLLSTLLTSFLPFSVPAAPTLTPPLSPGSKDSLPSHAPIKELDPLPLLSLFTPLTMKSTIHAPRTPNSYKDPICQNHSITLTTPESLLVCAIDLVINSDPVDFENPLVETLQLKNLSPWAKREVGEWFEERAEECDISAIGFGLGRYWEVSSTRAQCWTRCCKELGHLATCARESDKSDVNKISSSKQRAQGMQSHRRFAADEENADSSDAESPVAETSKEDLMRHLGRQDMVLKNDHVILRISWRLQFDWTSEVESVIGANAAFPRSWQEADDENALKKIPNTFDMLVRERGVFDAIKILACLLFDDAAP